MTKAIVFISHIAEEQEIAQALKTLVEASFLGLIEVFVSSDGNSIRLGRKWLESITKALGACAVEIIIASPSSVKRPWVNFEAGAGWIRKIPVIPLCHSGMIPSTLPTPLSELQAAIATDSKELSRLTPVLAEAIRAREPNIEWSPFIQCVQKYETEYKTVTRQIEKLEEHSVVPPTGGLLPHELAAFLIVGENVFGTSEPYSIWAIRNDMESAGYTKLAAGLAVTSLCRKNLLAPCEIDGSYHNDGPMPGVTITEDGWTWLEGNKDKISLTLPKQALPEAPSNSDDIPF